MSPGNQGVFQLLKEVTFRRILVFYSERKWVYFSCASVFSGFPPAKAEEVLEAAHKDLAVADRR
jgi:hypothetical protein